MRASAYRLADDALEQALLNGAHAQLLEVYFGSELYAELCELAQEAAVRARRGGPRVLILPGIMGSRLGRRRTLFDDVIWIDLLDIARGNLDELALHGHLNAHASAIEALGVLLFAYLKLKLRLCAEGFDAGFHPFDWRKGIVSLGQELKVRLDEEAAPEVSLVTHSMGGLVARAAIAGGATKIKRLVMLGTPNYGSFAPVQALLGTYPLVRKVIAAVDLEHTAEELAQDVFSTFPGLYQLLPSPERFSAVDLLDPAAWPAGGPRPRPELLAGVRAVQQALAAPDDRFFLIAGVNQPTVVGVRRDGDDFAYESSVAGDGTVPLDLARLPGVPTYYVEELHGSLANNAAVARAVADLLVRGGTDELPDSWSPARARTRTLRAAELRAAPFEGRRGSNLSLAESRQALAELASPQAHDRPALAPQRPGPPAAADQGYEHRLASVVVGRRRQHRLDIKLGCGSITDVDARAYVLGVFREVAPSGAAGALDAFLDGALTELAARRMFAANVGEVFIMPAGRQGLHTDLLLFVGLGDFDRFGGEVLRFAAENVVRTLVRARIEELATVLVGGGAGLSVAASLRNLLTGFLAGLIDTDREHRFRSLTVCERNPRRYLEIKEELYRLAGTDLFADVEVTLDEIALPEPEDRAPSLRMPRGPDPVYLIVRQEAAPASAAQWRAAVLTAGGKATAFAASHPVDLSALAAHLAKLEGESFGFADLPEFGTQLAALVLPESVRSLLAGLPDRHLVVINDDQCSRVPWEALRIGTTAPATVAGLSRRYLAENMSVAKWLEQRRQGKTLEVLLVVNPTGDLPGADQEGARVKGLFGAQSRVRITELAGVKANRRDLLDAFSSGAFEVVHYAGHAFFDPRDPGRSGIKCAGGETLSGSDLAGVSSLPSLVFFNACESGRVRRAGASPAEFLPSPDRTARAVSLAEAFLRGGVASYLGTYWPVGDDSAMSFAKIFYEGVLAGKPLGDALLDGRRALLAASSLDWADYILYGSQDFVVKSGD